MMPQRQFSGARLRAVRLEQGVKQGDLARLCDISPSYLNLIEHDRRKAGAQLLQRLAVALGVTSDSLSLAGARQSAEALEDAARDIGHDARDALGVVERFPQWADVIAVQARQIAALRDQVGALTDRMSNDPDLAGALHDVLTMATSIRSTASILTTDSGLDADWQTRFHRNLHDDSLRLSESLSALQEGLRSDDDLPVTPWDEVDAIIATARGHFPRLESGEKLDLSSLSPAAQTLMARWGARYRSDATSLPLAPFQVAARNVGHDPIELVRQTGAPFAQVLRRLASLPPGEGHPELGLVICDGGGGLLHRQPVGDLGFARSSPLCPLWPVFDALATPGRPARTEVHLPDGRGFDTWSVAETRLVGDLVLSEATMLVRAGASGVGAPLGPGCRLCVRGGCPARREPSVLRTGG